MIGLEYEDEYVDPLGEGIDYQGMHVRVIGADGKPLDIVQHVYACWLSSGDPYTGNGYILYFRASLLWLECCYKIMVAEALHPELKHNFAIEGP